MALFDSASSLMEHVGIRAPKNDEAVSERALLARFIKAAPEDGKKWTITPTMAAVMMERNDSDEWHNRPMSARGLARYVKSMKRGWAYTGDTIKFSKTGRLLDGQHRLTACIESGVPFTTQVVFGLDDESFRYPDTGIARTAGHIFGIEDIPNATQSAAGARLIFGYFAKENWDGRAPDIDNDQLLEFYFKHDGIQDSIPFARSLYRAQLIPMRWGIMCHYICARKNKQLADEFYTFLADEGGYQKKDYPQVHQIYTRLNSNAKSTSDKLSETLIGAYTIQAWNAMRRNERKASFRWRTAQTPNESFPRAV